MATQVGVIGAGNMGSGIAQKFAAEGADVVMLDLDQAAVDRGLARIGRLLDEGVARRVFKPEHAEAIRGRVSGAIDYSALAGCSLVVEAVFEDLDVKRKVFRQLEEACAPDAVLATNTSSFRVTDLQAGMRHPERVVGLHFFYHPAKNRLVEVIGGDLTAPATVDRAWRWMELYGKTAIPSGDAQGFVVNRFFVPWLNEAVRLHEEGHGSTAAIDRAACEVLHIGMGPFALMNATGVPISLHAANTLGEAFGAFYAPARLLERQVSRSEPWPLDEADTELSVDDRAIVESRLLGAAWLAAGQLVDEGISCPEQVDMASRVGLRWSAGPFEHANQFGVARALADIEGLTRRWGMRVPTCFAERVDAAGAATPFVLSTVSTEIRDSVGVITFERPAQLNALSPRLLADLEAAWDALEADAAITGVVLRGAGKAFMAGADLKFFVDAFGRGDLDAIQAFSARGAALFARIDASDKTVVALLDGLSLGGGSELVLCADVIVASERGSLGFPETGIGIYPGLGGTQRTVRRAGRPVARYLVLTGKVVGAAAAHALGLVDHVVAAKDVVTFALAAAAGEAPPATPADGTHAIATLAQRLLADGTAAGWLDGTRDVSGDDEAALIAKLVARKAPIAARIAAELIDLAELGGDVTAGLAAEADRLMDVFASADAREGITAVLERRRPTFTGS